MGVIHETQTTVLPNDTLLGFPMESFAINIDDPIIDGPVFVTIISPMEFKIRFTSNQFWRLIRYVGIHHDWKHERRRWFRSVALHTMRGYRRKGSNGWKQ